RRHGLVGGARLRWSDSGARRGPASRSAERLATPPGDLSLSHKSIVALDPLVDLLSVLGVVAKRCFHHAERELKCAGCRLRSHSLVKPDPDDFPNVRTAGQPSATAGRPISKSDSGVGSGTNAFPQEAFSQCGSRRAATPRLPFELLLRRRIDPYRQMLSCHVRTHRTTDHEVTGSDRFDQAFPQFFGAQVGPAS